MHLTARIKQSLLIVFTVTIISVCVVFATAGTQAEPESTAQIQIPAQQPASAQPVPFSSPRAVNGIQAEITRQAPSPSGEDGGRQAGDLEDEVFLPAVPKPYTSIAAMNRSVAGEDAVPDEDAAQGKDAAQQETASSGPLPGSSAAEQTQGTDISAFLPLPEGDVPDNLELLDSFIATAYCLTGTTSTGTYTTVGRTLAVNPGVIPYGSHVWLYLEDGTLVGDFYAEDTGSNMMEHPYVVDIYMGEGSYDTCILWGARRVYIYVESDGE